MAELLAHGTVVLDGGMSNALEDRGHDLSSDLGSMCLLALCRLVGVLRGVVGDSGPGGEEVESVSGR